LDRFGDVSRSEGEVGGEVANKMKYNSELMHLIFGEHCYKMELMILVQLLLCFCDENWNLSPQCLRNQKEVLQFCSHL